MHRTSGILLHPTSLPGPYGIGDLGAAADRVAGYPGAPAGQGIVSRNAGNERGCASS